MENQTNLLNPFEGLEKDVKSMNEHIRETLYGIQEGIQSFFKVPSKDKEESTEHC